MAGKKMRSRTNNSHNQGNARYKSEGRREKNKELRKIRSEKLIVKQGIKSEKRKELMAQAMTKLKLNSYRLKRLIGTPNIKRLTDVIEDRYLDAQWYLDRKKREQEKQDAKLKVRSNNKTNKPRKKEKNRPNKTVSK